MRGAMVHDYERGTFYDQRDVRRRKTGKRLLVFVKPTILIIDEMGYVKLDPNSVHYLFQVIV
ncbi:ATP-binding protein [Geobacillus sp. PA-3]|uniref:ATP-binding protein n=1 Tax=Geobacillus sp. PA-3 TaxID=1699078 RepID=UPI0035196395